MSWVTIIWSMVGSACFTLAAIYFLVWYRNRAAWPHFLFAVTAASTTAYAFCELRVMLAQTPAEFLTAMRWVQLVSFFLFVSITWFVRIYLRAGRTWFAWTVTGLRTFYMLLSFLAGLNVNYRSVTSLPHVRFLGESVNAVGAGVRSYWTLFGHFAVFLILVFVVDASIMTWRRGDHRQARMIGGGVVFFFSAGLLTSSVAFWGIVQAPLLVSPWYLGLVVVMGYELSRDLLRASQLVRELQVSEAGLRESEARMTLAVEAGDLGIWVWDLVRGDIWATDSWRALFGFAESERLAFDDVLERLHPDDRELLQQAHAMAVAGSSGGRYQTEYRLILPDGRTRWIVSQGRVEFDATGRPLVMRGTSREVTARKLAEAETQRLQQEIAHAGRVSMMGQLASGLAHEINQPLAAILRNAEAAELFLQHPSPDLDELRAILVDIRHDDERAGQVIDRMRGLLKRQTLDARQLDVRALVGDVAALVRVDAATRRVKLDVDVSGDLPAVWGDRIHLQQVLLNLILNGMDSLSAAGRDDRRVSVTARFNGAQTVVIAVGDNGPGIPADTLARVFDPFYTTKPNGMGMGLAISRTIVEAHGGRLWAENASDGGAAFRFTVPIAREASAA
ncbi:MAG TPA: ATP-binding protein [Vicinamibacterales bacterium]|jgi:PAS domain S-box-containing protein